MLESGKLNTINWLKRKNKAFYCLLTPLYTCFNVYYLPCIRVVLFIISLVYVFIVYYLPCIRVLLFIISLVYVF